MTCFYFLLSAYEQNVLTYYLTLDPYTNRKLHKKEAKLKMFKGELILSILSNVLQVRRSYFRSTRLEVFHKIDFRKNVKITEKHL